MVLKQLASSKPRVKLCWLAVVSLNHGSPSEITIAKLWLQQSLACYTLPNLPQLELSLAQLSPSLFSINMDIPVVTEF